MLNLLNDDHPKKIWAAKRVSWPRKKNIDYETRAISALESTFFQAGVLYEKIIIFKAIVEQKLYHFYDIECYFKSTFGLFYYIRNLRMFVFLSLIQI